MAAGKVVGRLLGRGVGPEILVAEQGVPAAAALNDEKGARASAGAIVTVHGTSMLGDSGSELMSLARGSHPFEIVPVAALFFEPVDRYPGEALVDPPDKEASA